ncbi:MAG: ECF transporter S component [Candidatus Bathyarchaeia archaeon]|jgi:uncharacterized membrane protein
MGSKTERRPTVIVAEAGIMAALVAVTTALVQIYIPATRGYLNFGDIMIFVSAFTFGPIVGGFAGGVGSAISDVATGYAYFSPFTLIIKGAEGLIAGLISNRLSKKRDILAVVIAGTEMVTGYFLAEFFGLSEGYAALVEVPANILQIVVGGTVGIIVAFVLRKRLPEAWRNQGKPQTTEYGKSPQPQLKS